MPTENFEQECAVCGCKWVANETLPCPVPELHKQLNPTQPNYELLQQRIDFLEDQKENIRSARHHEVFCLVLEKFLEVNGVTASQAYAATEIAERFANCSYPPPGLKFKGIDE